MRPRIEQIAGDEAVDGQLAHWNATLGMWEPTTLISGIYFDAAPTFNGLLYTLGWYIQINSAESLASATPVTAGEPGYNSHYVFNISGATGLPFTLRVTGDSVAELDGAVTPGDTEDLIITANGYYQTTKSWIDASQFSIVEGSKSCTIDVYRVTYWDRGNTDYRLAGCRLEWTPDAISWSFRLRILHIHDDGSIEIVDDVTFTNGDIPLRAEKDMPGKYKRIDYDHPMAGTLKEGAVIEITQSGIGAFFLEVKYDGGH